MAPGGNKKVANGLVALSSSAIVAVYAAGFMRTKAAAEKMDAADMGRRPAMPAPSTAGEDHAAAPIEPPAGHALVPTAAASPAIPASDVKMAMALATAPKAAESTASPSGAESKAKPTAKATESSTGSQHSEPGTTPVPVQEPNPSNSKAAEEAPAAAPTGVLMPKERYKDGTYTGWGTCRHGDIQASVTIEGGRITATSISQCWTRYSCSWVAHLPGQIVARQSPDCDYVTGATQSANAFYWAVVDALNKAKQALSERQTDIRRHQ